jgi:hypothetical protein
MIVSICFVLFVLSVHDRQWAKSHDVCGLYPRLTYLSLSRVASNGVEDGAIDGRRAEGSPEGSVAETGNGSHCEDYRYADEDTSAKQEQDRRSTGGDTGGERDRYIKGGMEGRKVMDGEEEVQVRISQVE